MGGKPAEEPVAVPVPVAAPAPVQAPAPVPVAVPASPAGTATAQQGAGTGLHQDEVEALLPTETLPCQETPELAGDLRQDDLPEAQSTPQDNSRTPRRDKPKTRGDGKQGDPSGA